MTLIFYADVFLSILLPCLLNQCTQWKSPRKSFFALNFWYDFLKDEEGGEGTLPYRNSDPTLGTHIEKISLKTSDSLDSLYSGQSSSSKAIE